MRKKINKDDMIAIKKMYDSYSMNMKIYSRPVLPFRDWLKYVLETDIQDFKWIICTDKNK